MKGLLVCIMFLVGIIFAFLMKGFSEQPEVPVVVPNASTASQDLVEDALNRAFEASAEEYCSISNGGLKKVRSFNDVALTSVLCMDGTELVLIYQNGKSTAIEIPAK